MALERYYLKINSYNNENTLKARQIKPDKNFTICQRNLRCADRHKFGKGYSVLLPVTPLATFLGISTILLFHVPEMCTRSHTFLVKATFGKRWIFPESIFFHALKKCLLRKRINVIVMLFTITTQLLHLMGDANQTNYRLWEFLSFEKLRLDTFIDKEMNFISIESIDASTFL